MQAVKGGCRSCPFPRPRSGNRRPPQKARRDPYLGPAGKGVGLAGGQVAPKPVPMARAPAAGASSHPTTANPSRLAAIRRFPSDETDRKDRNAPAGGASRRKRSRGSSGHRRRVSWPSASCYSSFSSPSVGAWSSGMRSSSTPRTPQRRTRSTPSSPARAGWRSPPRCWR